MGWRNHTFIYVSAGLALWGLHGLMVDFVPSGLLLGTAALLASAAASLGLLPVLFRLYARGREEAVRPSATSFTVGALLSFLLWFIVYMVMAKSLPWTYTKIVGAEVAAEAIMVTDHRYRKRRCHYTVAGRAFNLRRAEFCISKRQFQAHPNRPVRARILGKGTKWGLAVESIELSAPAIEP